MNVNFWLVLQLDIVRTQDSDWWKLNFPSGKHRFDVTMMLLLRHISAGFRILKSRLDQSKIFHHCFLAISWFLKIHKIFRDSKICSVVAWKVMLRSDQVKILHMPWQLSCHGMSKAANTIFKKFPANNICHKILPISWKQSQLDVPVPLTAMCSA